MRGSGGIERGNLRPTVRDASSRARETRAGRSVIMLSGRANSLTGPRARRRCRQPGYRGRRRAEGSVQERGHRAVRCRRRMTADGERRLEECSASGPVSVGNSIKWWGSSGTRCRVGWRDDLAQDTQRTVVQGVRIECAPPVWRTCARACRRDPSECLGTHRQCRAACRRRGGRRCRRGSAAYMARESSARRERARFVLVHLVESPGFRGVDSVLAGSGAPMGSPAHEAHAFAE